MSNPDQITAKENVAKSLSYLVENREIIALGSGSTVNQIIRKISESQHRPSIVSASSGTSEKLAEFGIDEITYATAYKFARTSPLICIDGGDQVLKNRTVILKGHGGAFTREKQLWAISSSVHVAIDFTKLTEQITEYIPIEIIPQSLGYVKSVVSDLFPGSDLRLRIFGRSDTPVLTDNNNYILDIHYNGGLSNIERLHTDLKLITGVIETGLFLEPFTKKCTIHIGFKDRVEVL